jgi:hypothetical protein
LKGALGRCGGSGAEAGGCAVLADEDLELPLLGLPSRGPPQSEPGGNASCAHAADDASARARHRLAAITRGAEQRLDIIQGL